MVDSRTYDVFGNIINQTGSSTGNLGFQSKYFDQESGLNYYYHRYYNPSIGRFINEDPIGFAGGLNMYGFVNNNPINMIDPFGLQFYDPEDEEINSRGRPMPRPKNIIERTRKNIFIKSLTNLFQDFSNPELLCCISKCAGITITKEILKEVMIDFVVGYFIRVSPVGTIFTLHLTINTLETITDKTKKCYIIDCAYLR